MIPLLLVSLFLNLVLALGYYWRRRRELRVEASLIAYAGQENWLPSGRGDGEIVSNVWVGSREGMTLARMALAEASWPRCGSCGNRDTRVQPGYRWDPAETICDLCQDTNPIE